VYRIGLCEIHDDTIVFAGKDAFNFCLTVRQRDEALRGRAPEGFLYEIEEVSAFWAIVLAQAKRPILGK